MYPITELALAPHAELRAFLSATTIEDITRLAKNVKREYVLNDAKLTDEVSLERGCNSIHPLMIHGECHDALEVAAAMGKIAQVNALLPKYKPTCSIFDSLTGNQSFNLSGAFFMAASNGHEAVIARLRTLVSAEAIQIAAKYAAASGQGNIVKQLWDANFTDPEQNLSIINNASRNGHFNLVIELIIGSQDNAVFQQGNPICLNQPYVSEAKGGLIMLIGESDEKNQWIQTVLDSNLKLTSQDYQQLKRAAEPPYGEPSDTASRVLIDAIEAKQRLLEVTRVGPR